jgi:hypothetical protein
MQNAITVVSEVTCYVTGFAGDCHNMKRPAMQPHVFRNYANYSQVSMPDAVPASSSQFTQFSLSVLFQTL